MVSTNRVVDLRSIRLDAESNRSPARLDLLHERWVPIPDEVRPDRWVSTLGRIRHGTRLVPGSQCRGYRYYVLDCGVSPSIRLSVHEIVLTAFVGIRPTRTHHGCHNNGNPSDNRVSNLRWGTPASNAADKVRHGRARRKLYPQEVREICARYAAGGVSQRALSREYGVSQPMIGYVVRGECWSHATAVP